ncbi:DUF6625 family protein [Pseudomonas sp. NKUCC02_KPG]|uniref:DUF6625 family protein n=1 Tax=Pseudomonas sp. NKUCC02_KPG TaxID=2842124 RepID=UPI001C5B7269|nr:DUF6625 family protein [Pseudomonas sp. NKUCC02_KPG]MBW3503693.1 hypothetical protein [Pseudomonas sp. NKUCC02_KPG]
MHRPPSILFLIPYFGTWPFWMPLFLESCRHNPDIQWLMFSDCDQLDNLPANVCIEPTNWVEYCQLVSQRLGINFAPSSPYKLCDLKPALGFIHADRLEGFDFWAFGDIDLIYGNLREYFTEARLARYHLLSTHERRVAGHLCLIRNTARERGLFQHIKDWCERFADNEHYALDEGAFSRVFLWRKNLPDPLFKFLGNFNPKRRRSEFAEAFSTPNGCIKWHDGSEDFPLQWRWHQGRLTNDRDGDRAFPYFHFVCWKRNEWQEVPKPSFEQVKNLALKQQWAIDAAGFH